ncbi:hemerythrin domain-containing protein [Desulfosarcina alkanivorans]|nr:hypothetical protein [Desulfosarcina alkanivorans]
MYYSYFSTGSLRIDSEHANIDSMIDLCRSKSGNWIPTARILVSAFVNHLDSEEKICREEGLAMTREHLAEHQLLKSRLALIDRQVVNHDLEKNVFLSMLRDILFYHISNFDKQLNPA